MTFVVTDKNTNVPLAIVGDIGIAQWVGRFYLNIGFTPIIRAHEAVECVTVDSDFDPVYCFEM